MKARALLLLTAFSAALQARTALAPLEAEPGSARVAGLGGISLGLDQGDGWERDPSALARQEGLSVSADEALLPLDLQRQGLQARGPVWGPGVWALRLSHTSYGALERRDDAGTLLGSFEPRRFGLGLGYGWPATRSLSLGSGLVFFQQSLDKTSMGGALAGFSARWAYAGTQTLSLAWQGANGDLAGAPALAFSGGLGSGLYALQAAYSSSNGLTLSLGLEQSWGLLSLRGAYEAGDRVAGFRYGAGVHWQAWRLDLAWQGLGELGSATRLSLSWSPPPLTSSIAPEIAPPVADVVPEPPLSVVEDTPQPVSPTAQPSLELEFRLPPSPVERAYQAEAQGDQAAAQARFEEALRLDPRDTRAWMGLGQLAYQRGDLDTAIQCFEQVLRLNPAEEALRVWLDEVRARRAPPAQK